ncbi:MAG: hypothetical protein AAGI23_08440 [Bacteroidota bacterium]
MSDAELKLQLIRLIDQQHGQALRAIYEFLQSKFKTEPANELTHLEAGYQAMAADTEREAEAFEWIEGTLNLTHK